jgi:polysaccharide export outer membrane protein
VGCQTAQKPDVSTALQTSGDPFAASFGDTGDSENASETEESAERVVLTPGEPIQIQFSYVPELNTGPQVIRSDGRIGLLLVGEIVAAGKTPDELREDIEELYKGILQEPEVAVLVPVTIREYSQRRVYVGGEVIAPGFIDMPGRLTSLEAIMQVGGFDMVTANPSNVVILRLKENGERDATLLDLSGALDGKDPGKDIFLQPKDVVYVPRTKIVKLNQWIAQHINAMIPQMGASYTKTTGKNTTGDPSSVSGNTSAEGEVEWRTYGVKW